MKPGTLQEQVARVLSAPGGPALSDLEIARRTGASRALVRKVRAMLGAKSAHRIVTRGGQRLVYKTSAGPVAWPDGEPVPAESSGTWPPALEPIFGFDGAAGQVEEALSNLLDGVRVLDHLLARLEVTRRGRRFGARRQELVGRLSAFVLAVAAAALPVAPCPFCGAEKAPEGCGRCFGGGWAPPDAADLFASMESSQSRRHWWRRPNPELVP